LRPVIGRPRNFTRNIHVELDENHEFGLKGLPSEFAVLLRKAGVSPEEFMKNRK